MSTSASVPPSLSTIGSRLLRGLALLGLVLGFGLVGGLLLLTLFPRFQQLFELMFQGRLPSLDLGVPVAVASLVLTPLAITYAARRLGPDTARKRVFVVVMVVAALVANLLLLAWFPAVREGVEALVSVHFWKIRGGVMLLALFTLLGLGFTGWWLLRPGTWRGTVRFGLVAAFIVTLDLVLVAYCPPFRYAFQSLPLPFFDAGNTDARTLVDVTLGLALLALVPLAVLSALWSRQVLRSWRWIGAGYLVLAPVLAYLATDDPVIRRPMTMEEIAPAFPGAEQSFEVLMRYGKNHSLGRTFSAPGRFWKTFKTGEGIDPAKPESWIAFLTAHRAEIEADWADLAPVRAWWAELDTFDRIGDLTPTRVDAEYVAFSPFRTITQHGCMIASLQALDGHGDEAIDTLLPVLQVGRKLQPSARNLVRLMVAIVIEKMSMHTATFILDHATVSPAARARLAAALAASGGGAAGARRMMAMEYAYGLGVFRDMSLGEMAAMSGMQGRRRSPGLEFGLNALSPFVYNPRATFNVYGDYIADAQELMATRQFDRIDPEVNAFLQQHGRPRFKNFAGALLLGAVIPNHAKVGASYWATQDTRTALLARLTKT